MKEPVSAEESGNQEIINRRKLFGKLGILVGGGLLSNEILGVPSELPTTEESTVFQSVSLKNARELKGAAPGDILLTYGFYELGDGGGACYRIVEKNSDIEINHGDVVSVGKDLAAVLIARTAINYKMFGAVGDSHNDDGVQINLAHEYANKYHLPVENIHGEFWIKQTRSIDIKTSVQWGTTIFHINEKYNNKRPVFRVTSYNSPKEIELNSSQKKELLQQLTPGAQEITVLKEYNNHLIVIQDQSDRIGFRAGSRYKGRSWAKEELFYVEEDGRILGDIAWNFKDYTDLKAYPAENSYLTLEGGSFYLSGDVPESQKVMYIHNGFVVSRSRTIIQNQWVGLEPEARDISMNPRSGFYTLSNVFDVTLENIRLIPWEQNREGEDRDVPAGTYGIGGSRWLNTTFRNITAEGTMLHWGVFGTNMNKNFRVENCRLNRVDVHFHCWNLTIKDSLIGNRGISVTGGGEMIIENTTCENRFFINLRRDFGAKWDGSIVIKNCRLKPKTDSETFILYSMATDFDYGYPIGLARFLSVEDFVIDYKGIPECKKESWLVGLSGFSKSKEGQRSFFPRELRFRNVFTEGREKGVRLMKATDPQGYLLPLTGSYDNFFFQPNAYMSFDNIQLDEDSGGENDYHLQLNMISEEPYDSFSLYPKIHISNCNSLSLKLGKACFTLLVENSTVHRISSATADPMPGEIAFTNCKFLPVIDADSNKPYQLSTELGTSFMHCVFHLPRSGQQDIHQLLSLIDFIRINKYVLYNHIHSRLGKDVQNFLQRENISLKSNFIRMLKSHHELE